MKTQTDTKHKALREILIDKIANSAYEDKPSLTALKKKTDSQLVQSLFVCTVHAERNFWREDIIKKLTELNPKGKYKNTSNGRLINELVEVAIKTKL